MVLNNESTDNEDEAEELAQLHWCVYVFAHVTL